MGFTTDETDLTDLPSEPTLYAPAPNPFNAAVNLKFYLPYAQDVSLRIFDVHGREILECCRDVMLEEGHTFSWDGSDAPAGLYFAVLEAEGVRRVQKMAIVK